MDEQTREYSQLTRQIADQLRETEKEALRLQHDRAKGPTKA
jgi:hypothetical protein